MADQAAGPTPPGQFLDELTGEMVSKSELKRRAKQREKDAKKAAEKVHLHFPFSYLENYPIGSLADDYV